MTRMERRRVLVGLGVAAGAAATYGAVSASSRVTAADGTVDWAAVRAQFRLRPGKVHLDLFLLASNPEPVRRRMAEAAAELDADPSAAYRLDHAELPPVLRFLGADVGQAGFCWNTTSGHGQVWGNLKIRADQEILISGFDHFVAHDTIDNACARNGCRKREIVLFQDPATATVDEIAGRLRAAITPATRAVATTWVMSSCGVRMPVAEMAAVVAEANRGRAEADRCLLIVDGVHGLGAVHEQPARSGADVFLAGLHKWMFGPRGTGIVWYSPAAVGQFHPQHATYGGSRHHPGGFHAYEARWALPATVAWHEQLGPDRVADRITALSTQFKGGLRGIRGVRLRTPVDPALSAGITCFETDRISNEGAVEHLKKHGFLASTAPHRIPYARIGTACVNTPEEIDRTVAAVRDLAGP